MCKRGRDGKPESDLNTVVECAIFEVGFNIVDRPIGDKKVSVAKNIVAFAGLNGNWGFVTFACR